MQAVTTTSARATPANSWAGMLVPSLTDFFFATLLLWLFIGGGGKSLLADGDTGWHIRTGDYILQHHTVPQKDIFSFTRPNEPWFAWEWLCDVLFASLHQAWGLKGVVFLAGILLCLTATVLFCHMLWSGGNLFFSLVVAGVCDRVDPSHLFCARLRAFSHLCG